MQTKSNNLKLMEAERLERKRFSAIFSIEMMERFGFYSFNVLLVVYFVSQMGLTERASISLFGAFSALLYVFIPFGGWVGDSYLGTKNTINMGGFFLFLGYLFLASFKDLHLVVASLGFIIIGNGLFKANPSSLLSKIYDKDDNVKRDSAYSLYYMSINVGSFISKIISPFVAYKYGWQYGFGIGGLGLILGVGYFNRKRKYFLETGSEADLKPFNFKKHLIVAVCAVVGVLVCSYLLYHVTLTNTLMFIVVGIAFAGFLCLSLVQQSYDRNRMIAALVFTIIAITFYTMYQQMYTSFLFYAEHNSNLIFLGITMHSTQFTVINPITIIIMAPVLAKLYRYLYKKGIDIRLSTKFTIGLMFTSSAFLILAGAKYFANTHGIVSANWVVGGYFLITMGEILISAIGLSMISQLIPEKYMGFATGIWFLSTAISGVTGGIVAKLTSPGGIEHMNHFQVLNIYSGTFLKIGLATLAVGVVMFILKFVVDRLISPKRKKAAA